MVQDNYFLPCLLSYPKAGVATRHGWMPFCRMRLFSWEIKYCHVFPLLSSSCSETRHQHLLLCDHNGIANGIGGALPVECTSQTVRTNDHDTKTGVPPRKAGGRRVAYEKAVDSPRTRKMDGATRDGTAEPT